jgi:hypothetical protein
VEVAMGVDLGGDGDLSRNEVRGLGVGDDVGWGRFDEIVSAIIYGWKFIMSITFTLKVSDFIAFWPLNLIIFVQNYLPFLMNLSKIKVYIKILKTFRPEQSFVKSVPGARPS